MLLYIQSHLQILTPCLEVFVLYIYQRRSPDGRANLLPNRELFRLCLSSSTGLK